MINHLGVFLNSKIIEMSEAKMSNSGNNMRIGDQNNYLTECCESTQSCETDKAHITENINNSGKIEDTIENVNLANTESGIYIIPDTGNYEEVPDPICCVRFTIFIISIILISLILFIISISLCSIENKCSLFRILF